MFTLDGQALGAAPDPASPRIGFDSRAHADGAHQLRAQARNLAGGSAGLEHRVFFDNTPPGIDGFPPETVTWCGVFTASATVRDALMGESVFLLDGAPVGNEGTASAPRVSLDSRRYPHGNHTLTLWATDAAGNVATRTRTLSIPNVFFC